MGAPRGRLGAWPRRVAVVALLLVGLALRLRGLDQDALFIDEAESTLNALSILEHGYPADHYLGLPMFENTLTEPWPESEEYEFRDTSYSDRGMAAYHGWLPLYAIAASLALHGIGPDAACDPPRVLHPVGEMSTRIRAARMPSVVFGVLFLAALYLAGRELYGRDAGLVALLVAVPLPRVVWLAQQARYYSAALALGTLAATCAWRVARHGRWRDHLLAALAFVLLFHTSSLAFAIVGVASLGLAPAILRRPGAWRRVASAAALVVAGVLPWMVWTGWFTSTGRIPMARSLLRFPEDYLLVARQNATQVLAGLAGLAVFAGLWSVRHALAPRARALLAAAGRPIAFLVPWVASAALVFPLLVPAASCSVARLGQGLIAPCLLLVAVAVAGGARWLGRRRAPWLASGAGLVLLATTGGSLERHGSNPYETLAVRGLVEHLAQLDFAPGARIYALPTQHFCLGYYTGLPVQSIAPVRREFLERHPGEIWILETAAHAPVVAVEDLQRLAAGEGAGLDEPGARALVPEVQARIARATVEPRVRRLLPAAEPAPAWMPAVCAALAAEAGTSSRGRFDYAQDNPAMFQGVRPLRSEEFWPEFFYCFVDPAARSGAHLNYAGRAREAEATLLPSSWVVLRCPARSGVRLQ